MRLFVAVDLDQDTKASIGRLQRRLAERLGADRSLRWVNPSHMHLTLAFLGEIAEARVAPIAAALSANIEAPPFVTVLQGLGAFPPRGAPRVLWLGVSDGSDALVKIQGDVASRLERLDIALERREFRPHLTLARWRDARPADRARALAAGSTEAIARVPVSGVTLYHSRLSPAGPSYTPVARATLT
jgi:2'-5' RNA ligase